MYEDDYSDVDQSIEESTDYQMDNDEIDGAEEGFLRGYDEADDFDKNSEEEFDEGDEIKND